MNLSRREGGGAPASHGRVPVPFLRSALCLHPTATLPRTTPFPKEPRREPSPARPAAAPGRLRDARRPPDRCRRALGRGRCEAEPPVRDRRRLVVAARRGLRRPGG